MNEYSSKVSCLLGVGTELASGSRALEPALVVVVLRVVALVEGAPHELHRLELTVLDRETSRKRLRRSFPRDKLDDCGLPKKNKFVGDIPDVVDAVTGVYNLASDVMFCKQSGEISNSASKDASGHAYHRKNAPVHAERWDAVGGE